MTTDAAEVVERWTQALTDHNLEDAVSCFTTDYRDRAPARRGEEVIGREQVRKNFAALFGSIADLRAELLDSVVDGSTVWLEWRLSGTRTDGTPMEFVGVNIFEVEGRCFTKGRIYTQCRVAYFGHAARGFMVCRLMVAGARWRVLAGSWDVLTR